MKIQAGYGYWDCTIHPIGGCFRRAGNDGVVIQRVVEKIDPPVRGCNAIGITDGSPHRVAFHLDNLECTAVEAINIINAIGVNSCGGWDNGR